MRHVAASLGLALVLALAGCPGPNPLPIDGGRDAGSDAPGTDAPGTDAPVDGGGLDGGGLDGGELDGGGVDGGGEDGGGADTGVPTDAPSCGNGAIDTGEDCEPGVLGGASCVGEGFDTGTLDCNDDCTFDTSMCRVFSCGDAMIEGTETCEGADFGGATCLTLGHDGGSLSCMTCSIVETACSDCGDALIEGTEVCDGTNVGTATCASQGFAFGTLGCAGSCGAYDTSGCSMQPHPTAGQVVITEFMPNPRTLSDNVGEWFEVRNTGTGAVNLRGCVVLDNQDPPSMFTITSDVVVTAGDHVTFGRTAMTGFTADYVYPSAWNLANTALDEIRLVCDATTIDSVVFDASWPWGDGISASLSATATTAAANDVAANWCAGAGTYEATGPNLGTPGAVNPACPVVVPTETSCTNGIDDDADGSIDCADSDCTGNPACPVSTPEICTNSIDDDGDGAIDCADTECAGTPSCPAPTTPSLLFSEYVEGTGNNKAVEILNTGTSAIDLAAASCVLRVYTTAAGTAVNLTGTVAAGDVFVACNTAATFAGTCDQTSGSINFNGDDAVVLICGGVIVDSIGQRGVDPGEEWGTGDASTQDNTLRRTCGRTADTNPDDAFTPAPSWSGFPNGTFDGLGLPACVTP